jgi:hypothetical protein
LALPIDYYKDLTQELVVHAEEVVVHGIELIARQKRLIEDLGRHGRDTSQAERLLNTFVATHESHIAHRDRLRRELRKKQRLSAIK